VPRAETTRESTSFHSVIWMARLARHTQSCSRMGFGPAWKVARFLIIVSRKLGSESRGNWWRS
jgi:hypothetical protein